MMRILMNVLLLLFSFRALAASGDEVYVDKDGVMRFISSDKEASFYGVNYTLPFAHAYRATGYLNKDRKECIDKDVYHISRLGVNAYRIHVWDVEISDADGNLINNEHLDLLDYLIYKLQERDIYTLITLQTNFGNGYPEKNINTGAFSYNYDKCAIHSDPDALKAQQRYVISLVSHKNKYTKKSYANDPYIVGFEINNEPCHSNSKDDTYQYICKMYKSIRQTGTRKPIFYNASHNVDYAGAYFSSPVEGVTYQWYPIGLVKGSTRKGNFLPHVDSYNIPFDTLPGYETKAKLIYEFDPADNLYSYLFPAITRTFRSAGFQWITQFAYDPLVLSHVNTEYQTHYLNLIYTPSKAISMRIAAEAAYTIPRNVKFPVYPADTVFDDFIVSYKKDLSVHNSKYKYIYTNNCDVKPRNVNLLNEVIGCGNSPIVEYSGTGAYFIEKLEKGVWRLEVMPDVVYLDDPFKKTSLKKQVAAVVNAWREMKIMLPDLGTEFNVKGINRGNSYYSKAKNGLLSVCPGTYLLSKRDKNPEDFKNHRNFDVSEYVDVDDNLPACAVYHTNPPYAKRNKDIDLFVTAAGSSQIDSIVLYTDNISFWNEVNKSYRMEEISSYKYTVTLPAQETKRDMLRYNIVAYTSNGCFTYPGNINGHPLDWDYISESYYSVPVMKDRILVNRDGVSTPECYSVPEWGEGVKKDYYTRFYFPHNTQGESMDNVRLCIKGTSSEDNVDMSIITTDGYSYTTANFDVNQDYISCKLKDFTQSPTILLPHAYPVFLDKYFKPETDIPLGKSDIEYIQIRTDNPYRSLGTEIWIEYL